MEMKKCPVCGWDIKEAVKAQVAGNEIIVCCDDCAKEVQENPSKYPGASK